MGKVEDNKQQKRDSLLESAFTLFIGNGFNKTSISDIVNHAGVAKGTFYLYFKDKYDIRNQLIAHKASQVFQNAYNDLLTHEEIRDFEDQVLFITDHILNQFSQNHHLVSLISKHLSWGFFKNSLYFTPGNDTPAIYTIYESLLDHASYTYRTPEVMFYMILEIVSGTSYNAILYEQPVTLEELKPELYTTIRGIFRQYRQRRKKSS
ncbi:MAG: TetR/AcrR family transcriptional regulator [Fusicatenibacter sp.]|nr:TetR/AcrR family transcriptional regulator [Fusicatenibacter sp.]